jgi:hypothetical protein
MISLGCKYFGIGCHCYLCKEAEAELSFGCRTVFS